MKKKPLSVSVLTWLRAQLDSRSLGALTGTDHAALSAAIHLIDLHTHDRRQVRIIQAFASVVGLMQPQCQQFAYHAIAHLMEWDDRQRIWAMADLPPIENPWVCNYEPGGSKR